MNIIRKPQGTLDILPEDSIKRIFIEDEVRRIFSNYNYKEIRTPTFEKTELFKRGIGEETDIVSKEMYSFHNDEFTLKPEMTAPVIRAYIENSLYNTSGIQKLFYISNMYRHERPQAGRYREFSQFGAEAIGSSDFYIDAEMISLGINILNNFGLTNLKIKINTIGNLDERKLYLEELKKYLSKHLNNLSETSKKRLDINPLRILDTKDKKEIEILDDSPILYDYLSDETKNHFQNVCKTLEKININFEVDFRLVRGFDYYTSTTFEIISDDLGSQNAVFGGGRYDRLVEQLGGKQTPAIGFACGIERLMIILAKRNYDYPKQYGVDICFVSLGNEARDFSFKAVDVLRKSDIICETDYLNRSIKAQMKEANKLNSKYVIIIGESELSSGKCIIKRMSDGEEKEIPLETIYKINKSNLHSIV